MELANGLAIVGGVAAAVYIVETAGKYGYAILKKTYLIKRFTRTPVRQRSNF